MSLWGATHASPVREPGENRGGGCQGPATAASPGLPGHSWPEEGLENNISGEAKAPIQAKRIWPREKSQLRFYRFTAIPVQVPVRETPALPEPTKHTWWKRGEYLHAAVMDTTPGLPFSGKPWQKCAERRRCLF